MSCPHSPFGTYNWDNAASVECQGKRSCCCFLFFILLCVSCSSWDSCPTNCFFALFFFVFFFQCSYCSYGFSFSFRSINVLILLIASVHLYFRSCCSFNPSCIYISCPSSRFIADLSPMVLHALLIILCILFFLFILYFVLRTLLISIVRNFHNYSCHGSFIFIIC